MIWENCCRSSELFTGDGAKKKSWQQPVVCYKTGDNTGRMDWEEMRERRRSAVWLPWPKWPVGSHGMLIRVRSCDE